MPDDPVMLWDCFIDFAIEHQFGCGITVPGLVGNIGGIEIWLIDLLIDWCCASLLQTTIIIFLLGDRVLWFSCRWNGENLPGVVWKMAKISSCQVFLSKTKENKLIKKRRKYKGDIPCREINLQIIKSNQISTVPIFLAYPCSVARQLNQCSTAKLMKLFHNSNGPTGTLAPMGERPEANCSKLVLLWSHDHKRPV